MPPPNNNSRLRVNDAIQARTVRLINAENKQVGIVSLEEALREARLAGLDLVEVSGTSSPPVCKILDYGKYQYEQAKREKEQRKRQKKIEVKGVRIGFRTDEHDQLLKKKRAEQFLSAGNKVRIEIVLRGREKAHELLARTNLGKFLKGIEIPYKIEEAIMRSPRGFVVVIAPKNKLEARDQK